MQIVVGTSGWQYKEWRGTFYPERMKEAEMLPFYAARLSSVEVNYTFRRIPERSVFERWSSQVPAAFQFVLKAPQQITHYRRLRDAGPDLQRLAEAAAPLGCQLGPLLVQTHPTMRVDLGRLDDFLCSLPEGTRAALEMQHESWYVDGVYEVLRAHNAALCIVEADDRSVPRVATADWGYLRLRRAEYSDADLHAWFAWVRSQPWGQAAVFFKHENEARGPRFATRFSELLATE